MAVPLSDSSRDNYVVIRNVAYSILNMHGIRNRLKGDVVEPISLLI
jgi:hypothetical protein